ncbi:hypothetical protein D3C72_1681010 [compost metagenome]
MLAQLLDRLERGLQVARIVHRVEHAEHIDTIKGGALDEFLHHVIGVVPIAEQVLPTQEHLLAGIGHGLFQLTDAMPWIFTQVTNAGIESRATPGLYRPETDLIELGRDRQHVFQAYTRRQNRLVSIAQHHIGDSECLFNGSHTGAPFRT